MRKFHVLLPLMGLIAFLAIAGAAVAQTVQRPLVVMRSDGVVFLLYGGERHLVNPADLSDEDLDSLPTDSTVYALPPYPMLVARHSDGSFYLVRRGLKVRLAEISLPDEDLDAIPEGTIEPLPSGDALLPVPPTPIPTATPVFPPPTPVPTATPAPATEYSQKGDIRCEGNAGNTWVEGKVYNRDGTPRNGVTVKVWAPGWNGSYSRPSGPEEQPERPDGYWDLTLGAGYPRAGTWYAAVADKATGALRSPVVTFNTVSSPTRTSEGGCQHVYLDWQRNY